MRTREGNKEKDILESAIKVFAEQGFHKAKIAKIAEIAGVATGSVYVYFKNKEDILLKIFDQLWGKLYSELSTIQNSSDMSSIEKVDAMIDLLFDVFTENPSTAVVFVNEQNQLMRSNQTQFTHYYEKFLDQGMVVLQEGVNAGLFSIAVDEQIFRHFIFGAIRNLLHHWAEDPQNFPLNKIRQNVKFLIKHGILLK